VNIEGRHASSPNLGKSESSLTNVAMDYNARATPGGRPGRPREFALTFAVNLAGGADACHAGDGREVSAACWSVPNLKHQIVWVPGEPQWALAGRSVRCGASGFYVMGIRPADCFGLGVIRTRVGRAAGAQLELGPPSARTTCLPSRPKHRPIARAGRAIRKARPPPSRTSRN